MTDQPRKRSHLCFRDLTYTIGHRTILDGIDLEVSGAESVALMGQSGAGKSTLLMLAGGLLHPTRGSVIVADEDLRALSARRLADHRARHIGIVFQDGELIDELSPEQNVILPSLWTGTSGSADRAGTLLDRFGVQTEAEFARDLSGGERQRVAVARALIESPEVVLADEPTGSLDDETADAVANLLFSLPRSEGCALLVVTHDRRIAGRADRVLHLEAGLLIERDAA